MNFAFASWETKENSNPPNVHKTEVYTMYGWPMYTFLALTSIVGSETGNLP